MGITSNEIRNYNKEVQAYQNKARELLAKKDYTQKELLKYCAELSELTGTQVTVENLESIYQSYMTQFQQTLKTGREIIERAKAEEQSLSANASAVNQPAQAQVQNQTQAPVNTNTQGSPFMNNAQSNSFMNNMGNMGGAVNVCNANGNVAPPQSMPNFGQFGNSPFGQNYDAHGKVGQI